jgi:hypothetical protein
MVERVCGAIQHGAREAQAAAITTAIFLIEKGLGRDSAGWDDEVSNEPVDENALTTIRACLVAFAERNLVPPPVASSIAALALFEDRRLKPLFLSFMRQYATAGTDVGILYQTMQALHRMGDKVFPEGRASLLDVDRNLQLARDYLKRSK